MQIPRPHPFVWIAAALLACVAAPAGAVEDAAPEAAAEEKPDADSDAKAVEWDQTRVTALAGQLLEASANLKEEIRRLPSQTLGGQTNLLYRLRDRVRLIHSEARRLRDQLADGNGRDETFHSFERINELRRTAAQDARRLFLQQPVMDQIDASRDAIRELSPYYGIEFVAELEERTQ